MKKFIICLLIIMIVFTNIIFVSAISISSDKVIVIDPGHGGVDKGTSYGDIYESDINLLISKELKKELEKRKFKVILTRNDENDISSPKVYFRKKNDFDNRIKIINQKEVDLYISIHLNYLDDFKYYGPQVFYNNNNLLLAQLIQKELNLVSGGYRKIKQIPNDTYMYDKINKSGVLIECGFLSNYEERNKLMEKNYHKELSDAIALGIIKYLKLSKN